MKKRLLSMLLVISMLMGMYMTVSAAGADTLVAKLGTPVISDGENITPGTSFNIPIEITQNPGTAALSLDVTFNSDILTCTGITQGTIYSMYICNPANGAGKASINTVGFMDNTTTGTYATLSFTVAADVSADSFDIALGLLNGLPGSCANASYQQVPCDLTGGTFNITYPVSVSIAAPVQNSTTAATLNGSYVKNIASANVTEVGFVYDTAADGAYASSVKADAVADSFSATLTGVTGTTYYVKSYVIADGVTYYSSTYSSVTLAEPKAAAIEISGEAAIEVPGEAQYAAAVKDQFGADFDTDVSWSVSSAAGVSINADGKLTVSTEAQTCNVTITAEAGEASDTFDVAITRPAPKANEVTISGPASIILPDLATGSATSEFTAKVKDQFGLDMADPDITWSVDPAVSGVSIDADGKLTVTTEAGEANFNVTATVDGVTSAPIAVAITKAAQVVTTVEMPEDATMTIPTDDSTKTETFTAKVYDQYGDLMDKTVTYTFATADSYVTVSGNTVSVVKGAEKNKTYTLTAECDGKSDSMTIKVVDIDIVWGATTIAANPTYGMTWGQIVSVAKGTASLEGSDVPGTWTVANANEIPDAGTQTYTVVFQSNDGKYTVTSAPASVEIAQKEITATWAGYTGLIYSGNAVSVTASVPVEDVNVIVTNGDAINAGDYTATAELDNANYKLSAASASRAYSIAKANIPTFDSAAAQQISVNKANKDNVLALISDEIKAYDFSSTALAGTIDLTTEIKAVVGNYTIFGTFTPDSTNFNAYTFQFALEVTEGDPQTLTFAQDAMTVTYGDAPAANVATITVGGTGAITYASNNTDVATVDENTGVVTFIKVGTATITATAAAEGDWAASSKPYDVKVNPKPVTISGATAANKTYDGNTDAVISSTEYTLSWVKDGDDVTVDASNAKAVFASANAGTQPVTFSGFILTGEDAGNYELSAQPDDASAEITPATEVTVKLTNTTQAPGEAVTPVGVETTPVVDPSKITVYYEVVDTPAVKAGDVLTPCGHAEDKTGCTADEGAECDHTDGCGYTVADADVPATYKWVTEVPTTEGTYPVKVVIEGDPNVADTTIANADMKLTLVAYSGGGSGGIAYAATVTKPENGSISVSPKYALTGSTVTIKVQPDEGYELGELVVVDKNGNEIEVTEKNGKYTFEMPASKVEISAEFVKADDTCASDKFSDLDTEAWYHEAVDYVIENGMMAGVADTQFAPAMNLTRGMVVQILWAMEGKPVVNYAITFEDVAADAWYTEAVRWAASEGVIAGYSAEAFGPADSVTREQMAVMLAGYARYKGVDVTKNVIELNFVDADSASDWAVAGLKWACGQGILSGKTGGKLDPTGTATRMEAAQMLMKFDAVLAD